MIILIPGKCAIGTKTTGALLSTLVKMIKYDEN